jgi:hypothetical protein
LLAGAAGVAAPATGSAGAGAASLVFAAVFFAAAFLVVLVAVGLLSAFGSAGGIASRSRRTTGGSTVDDADRTNSPISWSLVMTTLLSTPSSLASS